ncbi:unnamed protein product [Periconia digitata]|uniref:Uncharacterized protein n=1 Tax=Periconia digitata TaxID=1303443 RepID=A0A9W4UTK2_9PLEO|nr:unnamed protein product [Periconia digitata]
MDGILYRRLPFFFRLGFHPSLPLLNVCVLIYIYIHIYMYIRSERARSAFSLSYISTNLITHSQHHNLEIIDLMP